MPNKCTCNCCHAPFMSDDVGVFVPGHPDHDGLCVKCHTNPAWQERLRTFGREAAAAPVPPGKHDDGECECP